MFTTLKRFTIKSSTFKEKTFAKKKTRIRFCVIATLKNDENISSKMFDVILWFVRQHIFHFIICIVHFSNNSRWKLPRCHSSKKVHDLLLFVNLSGDTCTGECVNDFKFVSAFWGWNVWSPVLWVVSASLSLLTFVTT